jgi:hypothetical protein
MLKSVETMFIGDIRSRRITFEGREIGIIGKPEDLTKFENEVDEIKHLPNRTEVFRIAIEADKNKCQFCDSPSTNIYSFVVATIPDDPIGLIRYDYAQEPIYTCDKHIVSCKGFEIGGEAL